MPEQKRGTDDLNLPPMRKAGSSTHHIGAVLSEKRGRGHMSETFETALAARVTAMTDACTRCGKCVEVCPVTGPGGVVAEPRAVIDGIIDIVRTGDGPEASRKWANACVLTGECIRACDYGVNPRFLLGMARVAMARRGDDPAG